MSESILEKSLDDIIGEMKSARRGTSRGGESFRRSSRGGRGGRGGRPSNRINKPSGPNGNGPRRDISRPVAQLPRDIQSLAGSRPVLRVKNIHPDLNGEDLSNLFGTISPVDFVKFDNKNDSIAYVCFQRDNARCNGEAISRYDGKKAMGEHLIVESATSLVDRIMSNPVINRDSYAPRGSSRGASTRGVSAPRRGGRERTQKPPRAKPVKKSVDALDEELSAYMSGKSELEVHQDKQVDKLDTQLDNYFEKAPAQQAETAPEPVERAPEQAAFAAVNDDAMID